jgi:hypothetical protein
MILAAAEYGEGNGDPPPELELAFRCRRWNSLPESGGLNDQPAGLMQRLTVAENVYQAFSGMTTANDLAKWSDANPHMVKILESVYNLRKERASNEVPIMLDTGGDYGG